MTIIEIKQRMMEGEVFQIRQTRYFYDKDTQDFIKHYKGDCKNITSYDYKKIIENQTIYEGLTIFCPYCGHEISM